MSEPIEYATWQGVAENLDKIRVPGGWIYRSQTYASSGDCDDLIVGCSEAMVFVPDA